jgi:hypothetical protein
MTLQGPACAVRSAASAHARPPAREAPADVLRSLAAAVRGGTLLAWALAHCPDGRDTLADVLAAGRAR